jgi:hypothetical protein
MLAIREATKYTRPFSTWSHPNFPTISLNLCGKKTLAGLRDFLHLFRPAYILPCKRQAAQQILTQQLLYKHALGDKHSQSAENVNFTLSMLSKYTIVSSHVNKQQLQQ